MRRRAAAFCLMLPLLPLTVAASERFPHREDPQELIGTPAPALDLADWLRADPLEPQDLRGSVVLVRWWTDTCPFCSTSAPALRELQEKYADRGLRILGVFHPKPPSSRAEALDRAKAGSRRFGFEFPVAVDADWTALRRWWLRHFDSWTSVSFLVDKSGTIRWVHPGGEYHHGAGGSHWDDHGSCNREYDELMRTIEALLEE